MPEYELEVQFRCAGSDGFVNWINNTLGVERTANVLWDGGDGFDFKIMSSPEELEAAIRAEGRRRAHRACCRGVLLALVRAEARRHPGRRRRDRGLPQAVGCETRQLEARPGIPSAALWATDPSGIDQIGCVYNIQGFELDYVGVIWGKDLVYDFDRVSGRARSSSRRTRS